MKPRDIVFVVLGTAFAAVFIRLGFWQLERLSERRALNSELRARAAMAPIAVRDLPADTAAAHYRRVTISGTYDFDHEIVITNRSRDGSPGVNIITPVRLPGSDSAVLVNRGWVYAPDGMTVDLSKWREPASMSGEAFVENFSTRQGEVRSARHRNAYRWLDRPTVSQAFPYPVAGYYLVLIGGGSTPVNVPPRLDVPPLDEGSHRSYALQWFSFAAISIIGMFLFVRRK
ncbi:MAG: SURF1 family protein [Gemmatimonadaceae bacterium]|nr:SURF1 family protein [Gemmatimonadaceae bacterium]